MMINALKSINSCGHDGLSTILLKAIKYDICKPITLIINQSLYTGIFPNKLKLAEVILIYKKGDNTKLDNYRPISILPAISKIFERAIFDQLSDHLKSKKILYCRATRRVGTHAGRRAHVGARSDHWIC